MSTRAREHKKFFFKNPYEHIHLKALWCVVHSLARKFLFPVVIIYKRRQLIVCLMLLYVSLKRGSITRQDVI